MPRTKTTKAAVTKTTKAAVTEKTTPVKTEETVKTEEVKDVETKSEETKAEETKKAASSKKEPVKRATRKRTATTKKTAVKTVTKRVNIQFGGKDLKIEEIEAAVKKAWMDETGKKETEIEKLEIYIPASVKKIGKYITLTDVKKIYCQKNTVAQKYAKKNKVAVEITGTKRTQQNYVAQKLLLKKNAVTLKPDSSYRVEAEMVPFYASKQELAYSSNKPEIAAVSDEGFVTAKKAGSAVITVKTTDGSKKKVKLKVTVRPGKPVNFIVQKKGKKKAVFSWDPVAGAAGYEVAQADSQKGKYTTIWQQKKKTSVELKISKDKYYKVRAWYKKDGELIYGAFSKAIKAS